MNLDKNFREVGIRKILNIPPGFQQETYMKDFAEKYRRRFTYRESVIEYPGFIPSYVIKPGQVLIVKEFEPVNDVILEEVVSFLYRQKAVFLGLHGLMLMWETGFELSPRSHYLSIDRPGNLGRDREGHIRLPAFFDDGDETRFYAISFEQTLHSDARNRILGFFENI